ncbi:hypothetical protein DL771_010894 [Monosporascus sp. 5C6A]|nr:hypothetical protein DL771_010894 [Monosporascus sp. 5C6A]
MFARGSKETAPVVRFIVTLRLAPRKKDAGFCEGTQTGPGIGFGKWLMPHKMEKGVIDEEIRERAINSRASCCPSSRRKNEPRPDPTVSEHLQSSAHLERLPDSQYVDRRLPSGAPRNVAGGRNIGSGANEPKWTQEELVVRVTGTRRSNPDASQDCG